MVTVNGDNAVDFDGYPLSFFPLLDDAIYRTKNANLKTGGYIVSAPKISEVENFKLPRRN
ncbi:MAG: hypothetical protein LBN01_03315 [Endomicrobium sp.]|nr:hypothetical protein [Endomicrobium sp.]